MMPAVPWLTSWGTLSLAPRVSQCTEVLRRVFLRALPLCAPLMSPSPFLRWEKYTDMGRIVPGTRFITFKVPLREVSVHEALPVQACWLTHLCGQCFLFNVAAIVL